MENAEIEPIRRQTKETDGCETRMARQGRRALHKDSAIGKQKEPG